jgi:hypothetical protein
MYLRVIMRNENKMKLIDSEIRNNLFLIIVPLIFLIIWGIQGNGWIILGIESIIAITVLIVGIVRGINLNSNRREIVMDLGYDPDDDKIVDAKDSHQRFNWEDKFNNVNDYVLAKWVGLIIIIGLALFYTFMSIFVLKDYYKLFYIVPISVTVVLSFLLIISFLFKKE